MLAPKPTSPEKVISLALALVVTVGLIAWLVYANFVNPESAVPVQWQTEFSSSAQVRYPPVPSLNPNPPVFTSRQFTELRVFVPLPVEAGPTGRPNPFAPLPPLGTTTVSSVP